MEAKVAEESLRRWLAGESPQECACGGTLIVRMASRTGRPRGEVGCNRCREALEASAPWHASTSTAWRPAMGIPVRCPDDHVLVTFEEAADAGVSRRMIYSCPWCGGSTRPPISR
jgi:hypothetical protein